MKYWLPPHSGSHDTDFDRLRCHHVASQHASTGVGGRGREAPPTPILQQQRRSLRRKHRVWPPLARTNVAVAGRKAHSTNDLA